MRTGTALPMSSAFDVEASENPSRLAVANIALHQEAEYTSAVVT
jgi:hypothetical protein